MNVREYLGDNEKNELVTFTDSDQFLALLKQPDGRIDLVDSGCGDTGTDCADWTTERLRAAVAEWLDCVDVSDAEKAEALEGLDF